MKTLFVVSVVVAATAAHAIDTDGINAKLCLRSDGTDKNVRLFRMKNENGQMNGNSFLASFRAIQRR